MYPHLYHIYGPFYINNYGVFIALGIIAFYYLIKKHENFTKIISVDKFKSVMLWSIIVGIISGRLLWLIEEWKIIKNFSEVFEFWLPGYSFLGTLIGLLGFVPFYLNRLKIEILPFFDLITIYAPLLHSIARIGCFLAGCCHGIPTKNSWGIVYTHPEVAVPLKLKFIKLHPTQLYTSAYLFILFLLMYFVLQKKFKKSGQLTAIYLIFTSIERFFNDFYRADREFHNFKFLSGIISTDQLLSLLIFALGLLLFIQATYKVFTLKQPARQIYE